MISSNNSYQSCQSTTNWELYTIEKEVDSYNSKNKRIEKIKIQLKFTSDQKIIYLSNGAILRIEQGHKSLWKLEQFNNLDQLCNLSWKGQYGKKKKKVGKWIALWNKEFLSNVEGQSYIIIDILYFKEGLKQGLWKDLFFNFMKQAQIFEFGEYYNGLRIGKWKYIYKDEMIGGGCYNNFGIKKGKWIDLDKGFQCYKQVIYNGEYNMNGLKIGRWDIMFCSGGLEEYKQIGGGLYDKERNQKKIGKWVELDDQFKCGHQITHNGEYNMNGMKVGRWDIMYWDLNEMKYKKMVNIHILIFIVVVDHMINKVMSKRLESGQNWMKGGIIMMISLIMVNIV